MNSDNTVFSALEDAVSALVADKYGPGCVVGAWVIVAETVSLEDGKDSSTWMCEGEGSILARRGLLESARDVFAQWSRRFGDD